MTTTVTIPRVVLPNGYKINTVFGDIARCMAEHPDYVRVEHVEITLDQYARLLGALVLKLESDDQIDLMQPRKRYFPQPVLYMLGSSMGKTESLLDRFVSQSVCSDSISAGRAAHHAIEKTRSALSGIGTFKSGGLIGEPQEPGNSKDWFRS